MSWPVERRSPVETTNVQLPTGDRLQIPTGAETLRMKGYLLMCRNSSRDYAEFADLVETMDTQTVASVLAGMDKYYCGQQPRKQWVATQLVRRLADPRPADDEVDPDVDWVQVKAAVPVGGRRDAGGGEVTLAVDGTTTLRPRSAVPQRNHPWPLAAYETKPVEFWPTAAIRMAIESGDLTMWQRIVVALKRDPYGRTARQVEEVLETGSSYGISKALSEVLTRSREQLEADERAEVAQQIKALIDRSGLGVREFASRIGVSAEELPTYLEGDCQPVGRA